MTSEASEARAPDAGPLEANAFDSADFRRRLLAFYDERARELPWRGSDDPYHIWISEVMAQQTRVETVIPYYERWLRRFPTVAALADAEQGDVLKAWEGLGYYSRARNLHRAAGIVRERHAGRVPDDPAALRALPGFGDYTVGAVASIAYGKRLPAVDGNVRRVLSRVFDLPDPSAADLRRRAEALVPADRPGDFNQATMELGARICTPRSPLCDTCPVAVHCAARAAGTQAMRPLPKRRAAIPEIPIGTAVVRTDGRLLLVRRPQHGLLAGLWTLPGREAMEGEAPVEAARRAAAERLGAEPAGGDALAPVRHTFSHRRELYHPFRFTWSGPLAGRDDLVWADSAALASLALPVAQRSIAEAALD